MYVCEDCHKTDIIVTKCNHGFKMHASLACVETYECDICGKKTICVFCDEYQVEMLTRSQAKREAKKHETKDLCGPG